MLFEQLILFVFLAASDRKVRISPEKKMTKMRRMTKMKMIMMRRMISRMTDRGRRGDGTLALF